MGYDQYGNLAKFKETVKGTQPFATEFVYDDENRPITLNYGADRKTVYTYDDIGRILSKKVYVSSNSYIITEYTYIDGINGSSTNLVRQIVIKKSSGTQISKQVYDYDDLSRIKSVTETPGSAAGNKIEYFYDALGQLTRVNDPFDTTAGTTWVFSYDVGGNIVSKTAYPYTTGDPGSARNICTFTYGNSNWRDLLTGRSTTVNGVTSSTAITRDAIGNRLSDGIWSYTWTQGKQLAGMSKSDEALTFAYNEEGLHVRKTSTSGGETEYMLHGRNVVHLTNVKSGVTNELHFFFDADSRPAVVVFNGTSYRYLYNLQGDVIGLVNGSNSQVVSYRYDAWGRLISTGGSLAATLGKLQPFRYRCYVYDEETGLYYVNSRYYDPEVCRWISADSIAFLGANYSLASFNLFNYCLNDATNRQDRSGNVTFGKNTTVNANLFFGVLISIGDYYDDKGNREYQLTYALSGFDDTSSMGVFDFGFTRGIQITDRETIYDLYGYSITAGASGGSGGFCGGFDIISFSEIHDPNGEINGIQASFGVGGGFDTHVIRTNTIKLSKDEIGEIINKLSKSLNKLLAQIGGGSS